MNFEVRFYYSFQKNRYIQLNIDSNKNLCLIFSENFLDEQFKNGFADYINLSKIIDNSQKPYIKIDNLTQYSLSYQYLLQLLNNLFENKQEDLLFIIAGRNATVTYSDLFDKYLFASIQIDLKENREKLFANKRQMIDESLMLQFIEKVELIKRVLRKFSGFDGLINYQVNNKEEREYLKAIKSKINLILKGEYSICNSEEKIIFNKNERYSIDLRNASSCQQECIRILEDIFLNIIYGSIILRIIEEPEAHLFPIAQKHLIELLAIMVNRNEDNQLIITTHSPYILSVFNNLLVGLKQISSPNKA
ncbi:AAA family ATPase [Microcystis sp.]|uniref:AAA family ATPase n=1 Tax=Microcystis sp. TaxID=1127 RepID=UPI00391B554C